MSEPSMYVADEFIEYWPFLPKPERRAKIEVSSPESTESLLSALSSNASSSPALAWIGSGDRICGSWHSATTHG
jgi:hypothetical protein